MCQTGNDEWKMEMTRIHREALKAVAVKLILRHYIKHIRGHFLSVSMIYKK